jgi:hypothetical protein
MRRYSIAISAAVASITLALGVTAASLLGWLGPPQPATSPPEPIVEPTVQPDVQPAVQPIEQPPATAQPEQAPVDEQPTIVLPPLEEDDVTLAMHDDRHGEDDDHDHERDDDDDEEEREHDDDD